MDGDIRRLLSLISPSTRRFGDIAKCTDCAAVLVVHPSEGGCRHCGSGTLQRY